MSNASTWAEIGPIALLPLLLLFALTLPLAYGMGKTRARRQLKGIALSASGGAVGSLAWAILHPDAPEPVYGGAGLAAIALAGGVALLLTRPRGRAERTPGNATLK